jgi:hypothetical protein
MRACSAARTSRRSCSARLGVRRLGTLLEAELDPPTRQAKLAEAAGGCFVMPAKVPLELPGLGDRQTGARLGFRRPWRRLVPRLRAAWGIGLSRTRAGDGAREASSRDPRRAECFTAEIFGRVDKSGECRGPRRARFGRAAKPRRTPRRAAAGGRLTSGSSPRRALARLRARQRIFEVGRRSATELAASCIAPRRVSSPARITGKAARRGA